MYWTTYKRFHDLCYSSCDCQSCSWSVLHEHARSSIGIIPVDVSASPAATTGTVMLRSIIEDEDTVAASLSIRHNTGTWRGDLWTSSGIEPADRLLGVFIIDVWSTATSTRLDPECWSVVVFLHRNVRLVQVVLPWRFLASSILIRPWLDYPHPKTASFCHHDPSWTVFHLQAVPVHFGCQLVFVTATNVPTYLPPHALCISGS